MAVGHVLAVLQQRSKSASEAAENSPLCPVHWRCAVTWRLPSILRPGFLAENEGDWLHCNDPSIVLLVTAESWPGFRGPGW
jgi:hypothetical protein